MQLAFLVHHDADNVGVAVRDIGTNEHVSGGFRHAEGTLEVAPLEPIPLGYKFALRDVAQGSDVVEYGVVIGAATANISTGQLVHTHNLAGKRWA